MEHRLPTGTVTFLFTDIEGSTKLLHELGSEQYAGVLEEHRRVLRAAFERHGGVEVDTQGDAFFIAFSTAPAALAAASEAQSELATGPIHVRMGIHTGAPYLADGGYVGADVHRAARIAAAGHGGQVLVSASTAALAPLPELRDLGQHRLKDLGAAERIYQLGGRTFPALKTLRQTNLPVPATPFVGRERELGEVVGLLSRDGLRLVTLTGPAGTGKTRLALQAAGEAFDRYPDGVFWVPLAALRDPARVLDTAAQALGSRNGIAERIADRRLLLLLDNLEQVIDAADDLAGLLATCPNLQLLVTSREVLQVPGEQAYAVPPLARSEAVALFAGRAQAVDPGFVPDAAVEELCARLDDLPLALELAAARVSLLSPEQLLDRLSKRLDLLKAGRGVEPRQQTLRATIEWSYELLSAEEQTIFRRLAVFRGGCSLDAAEVVAETEIDTLQSLVAKSLLRRQGNRLIMLETIREYAGERLEQCGEEEDVSRRHAEYFFAVFDQPVPQLRTGGAPEREAEKLAADFENLRAAVSWFARAGDVATEAKLATAAYLVLWPGGRSREMHSWLVNALNSADRLAPELRADLLGVLALAAAHLEEVDESRRYAEQSLELARELGDDARIEWALRASAWTEQNPDRARAFLEECESLLVGLGDELGLAWVIHSRGEVELRAGEYERARVLFEEAANLFEKLSFRYGALNSRGAAGWVLLLEGRREEAEDELRPVLEEARALGASPLVAEVLGSLGVARVDRDVHASVRLLARSRALMRELGTELVGQSDVEEAERTAREQLGDEFEREWAAGSALALDEAVALALAKS